MGAGNGNSLIALNMDDDGFTESMVISNPTYSTYSNFYAIQEAGILESWKKPIIMISLKFDFQLGRGVAGWLVPSAESCHFVVQLARLLDFKQG